MKRMGRLAPELLDLQQRLASWRGTRRQRGRLPEWLWHSSVALARAHGVNRVARALRLDYYALKRRLSGAGAAPAPVAVGPAFVELGLTAGPGPSSEYRVELLNRAGGRMTVSWCGEAGALGTLAQEFWQQGR